MTTTRREPFPFVTKVIDMFGDWLKQRRELNELTRPSSASWSLLRASST
jgi:hypothetical protein